MIEDVQDHIFPNPFQPQHTWGGSSLLPSPGPNASWTAGGVIEILEPLITNARRTRLRSVLDRRIKSVSLVLDDPHKPHNRAAVVRSCEAFGVQRAHFLLPPKPKAHEKLAISRLISRGSHNWIDIIKHTSERSLIEELKSTGHRILITHPKGRLRPEQLGSIPQFALVMGNERYGVSSELTEAADDSVAIAMSGFAESLNLSVTAAILLQAAVSQRPGDLNDDEKQNIYARWLRISVPRADEVLNSFSPC
jgi:tRNA (guanosine-2'-O-)-methyltransferase